MRLFRLALRNLTRNTRRTLLTALAIGFGAFAVVVLEGFVNGFVRNVIEASVLAKVGAIQVFRHGYIGSDDPLKMTLPDDPALVSRIRGVPGVTAIAPRLDFDGMISSGSRATMFVATAVDPVAEYRVCPQRASSVAPGSRPLGPGDDDSALIGKTLADALGAARGSSLVMQAAGAHAGTNALDVAVSGFLPNYHPTESKRGATVTLAFAQRLLRASGQVTEYVVGVSDLERVEQVAGTVRAALGADYRVTTWQDLDPRTRDRAKMLRFVLRFVTLVLFLLVATGIVNTMMMSVHERVREIGMMLAVGLRRRHVTALFLWEAIALAFLSAVMGTAAGWALVRAMGRHGLVGHAPGSDSIVLYPGVSGTFLLLVLGFSVLGAVMAALYPAWTAARLRPVDALRAI
jgi:putative ABC transport system permease protein